MIKLKNILYESEQQLQLRMKDPNIDSSGLARTRPANRDEWNIDDWSDYWREMAREKPTKKPRKPRTVGRNIRSPSKWKNVRDALKKFIDAK